MKRHILAMTNIENSMDGEDAEETHRLLTQEQEYRSTQRFVETTFFGISHKAMEYLCVHK